MPWIFWGNTGHNQYFAAWQAMRPVRWLAGKVLQVAGGFQPLCLIGIITGNKHVWLPRKVLTQTAGMGLSLPNCKKTLNHHNT